MTTLLAPDAPRSAASAGEAGFLHDLMRIMHSSPSTVAGPAAARARAPQADRDGLDANTDNLAVLMRRVAEQIGQGLRQAEQGAR